MGKKSKQGRHGSVRPLGEGKWRIRVQRGYTRVTSKDEPGTRLTRPRVVSETFTGTYDEAIQRADDIYYELEGDLNYGEKMVLKRYYEGYFRRHYLPTVTKGTANGYESVYKNYIRPVLGEKWPPDITRVDLQRFVDVIPTGASQRKAMRYLRSITRAMIADLRIKEPIYYLGRGFRIEYRPHQMVSQDTWTAQEVLEAMGRLKGNRFERCFLTIAGAGLRREEACPLVFPTDFKFIEGEDGILRAIINIERVFTEDDGFRSVTKTSLAREAVVSAPFAGRLFELAQEMDEPEPLLVSNKNGIKRLELDDPRRSDVYYEGCRLPSVKPGGMSNAWRMLFYPERQTKTHLIAAGALHGMRQINLKNLRHTNVSLGRKGGAADDISAKAHGHSQQVGYRYLGTEDVSLRFAQAVERELSVSDKGRIRTDWRATFSSFLKERVVKKRKKSDKTAGRRSVIEK